MGKMSLTAGNAEGIPAVNDMNPLAGIYGSCVLS